MASILVVEDNAALGRLYNTFLSKIGFTVVSTTTCQEAVEKLVQTIPDIVILDINLPDSSGLTVAHLIRTTPHLASIPIIVLSATEPSAEEIQQYEIKHVLRKPVSLPVLHVLVKSIAASLKDKARATH